MESFEAFLANLKITELVVGGLVGAVITLLINKAISFFRMKRAKYCISKKIVSSSVYKQTDADGLKISFSYNGAEIQGPLSVLSIRLRNDGEEDLMYSRRVSHLLLSTDGLDVLDVTVYSKMEGVKPEVNRKESGIFELKWDLLKRDESFFIKVVVNGEVDDLSKISFDIRAEGIDQIKTPEFRVKEVMVPILISAMIISTPVALFWPAKDMFANVMPTKVFFLILLAFCVLLFWVLALRERIKWLKEQ